MGAPIQKVGVSWLVRGRALALSDQWDGAITKPTATQGTAVRGLAA